MDVTVAIVSSDTVTLEASCCLQGLPECCRMTRQLQAQSDIWGLSITESQELVQVHCVCAGRALLVMNSRTTLRFYARSYYVSCHDYLFACVGSADYTLKVEWLC
jgi:hypothetical protein